MRPRPLPSLALAAASVVVTLLVLEAAFRLLRVPVGTVQINRATVRRSTNPRLRFELRPGGVARAEVEYRIGSQGLRGPEVTVTKPEGVLRVAVLGDSIAFGYWVAERDGFPRQLESMLKDRPGARVQVLNFGVPGYNLDQEIELLRARGLAFSPDVVILAFCLNDLEGVFSYELGLVQERTAREGTLPGRLREAMVARSVLLSWVEYRLAELEARRQFVRARNPVGGPLDEQALERQKEALLGRFSVLRALLASRGIEGLVAVFPAFNGRWERYPYRELHRTVEAAAEASGLAVVDLLECYSAYPFREVRVDVVHPNPMGHRIAAHAIRDALCGHRLLCEGPVGDDLSCRDYRAPDFPTVRGY